MDSKEIDVHFEEEYVQLIDAFNPEDFQERALQHVMGTNYIGLVSHCKDID
jgi:hypothetical protein